MGGCSRLEEVVVEGCLRSEELVVEYLGREVGRFARIQ